MYNAWLSMGGNVNVFRRQELIDTLAEMRESMGDYAGWMAFWRKYGVEQDEITWAQAQNIKESVIALEQIQDLEAQGLSLEEQYSDLYAERVNLAYQVADAEQEILDLMKQQRDIKFLEEQIKLLNLISEYGLDAADILEGVTIGLGANIEDLLTVITDVMEQIVQETEAQLQISSPSKVFEKIGGYVMQGLATGITNAVNAPLTALQSAFAQLSSPSQALPALAAGNTTYTDNSFTFDTTIASDIDEAVFQERVLRTVKGALA